MDVSSIGSHIHAPAEPVSAPQRALIQAVKAINPTDLFGEQSEFTFVMDQKLKEMIVLVIDRATGEVKLQIPAEYLLRLAEEMKGG